jgi:cytochrome bd-type quinol oxidase subunit 2
MADPTRRALGGPGVVLVVVYGVLALAATGRSVLQILSYYDRAPLAYILSALAAAVYILATWCLARGGRWVRVGVWACTVELVGVLVVGAASYLLPDAFPDKTVWSHFGQGYGFIPLVLPVLGLLWFRRVEREARAPRADTPDAVQPGSAGPGLAAGPGDTAGPEAGTPAG